MATNKPRDQKGSVQDPINYEELIRDLSVLIEEGRKTVARSVNVVLTATYWLMGRRIIEYEQQGKERAQYGAMLLINIAKRLVPKFGRGFNERNLDYMRQFYLAYPKISNSLSSKSSLYLGTHETQRFLTSRFVLAWTHYRLLMRIDEVAKRNFYEAECLRGGWSVRQLDRQVQSLLYERTGLSRQKRAVIAKAHQGKLITRPEDEIKDPYVLEFLDLKDEYSESDLEDALITHLEHFLLELGTGFTFIARQKRFEIGGNHYRIDLLLFNRLFKALTLIDLKIGDFNHADAGQMNFYLNWAKREAKFPGENAPVGIVLCSGKNQTYVEYALGNISNKIFVSQYKLQLPKTQDLKKELERSRARFLEHKTANERIPDSKIIHGKE